MIIRKEVRADEEKEKALTRNNHMDSFNNQLNNLDIERNQRFNQVSAKAGGNTACLYYKSSVNIKP